MSIRHPFIRLVGSLLLLTASVAQAGETALSLMNTGMSADCADYAANVSGSEGNFGSVSKTINGTTCYGAFQFCVGGSSDTLSRYYDGTPGQFLDDPKAQVAAWMSYQNDQWRLAQRNGLTSAVGQRVCYRGECATLTQSSILKSCQFGCAKGGKLDNFVKAGFNCDAAGTKDGAGTSVCKYLISGSGFSVACITNTNDGYDC
ncbi:acyltransferase [Microvirga zambiensis]|uniref:acyltransferase n=1 Tax=Microvirga zambiensis TaxID=1402137 RepID=UPI00191DB0C4|nr:acyltransferase [Microvirga zambiensis]